MDEKINAPSPSKRGRKPLGERAMTAAERKRVSRSRQASEGVAEVMVSLRGGTLNFIDQLVVATGQTRPQVITGLLDMAIARVANATAAAEQAEKNGASPEAVEELLYQALNTTPRPELVQQYKDVMGIK